MLLSAKTLLQNRYLIVRQIGQGGMGAVYEALDQRLGHRVALKQMILNDPRLLRAFEREARILAQLHHPALPNVSDYFTDSDSHFLVMQYIPGDDFEILLKKQGTPFPVMQVLEWADQLLDVLEFLHAQDPPIIHRDIKPANMKLLARGQIILLDFGLAKGGTTGSGYTVHDRDSVFAFTPHYAPLEQINGTGTDERSDLYALGTTLYHLLTGNEVPTAMTRAGAEINENPDPLRPASELNPEIPVALAKVLAQATALNATQRPQSAHAMRHALRQATLTKNAQQEGYWNKIYWPIRLTIMGTITLAIGGLILGLFAEDPIGVATIAAIVGALCSAAGSIIWIIADAIYRQIKK